MIIIKETGRFGNQLFQFNYCLKLKKKNESILFLGFSDLQDFLKEDDELKFVKYNIFLYNILLFFFSILKKLKIISSVKENEYQKVIYKKGFFKNIKFIQGHFENEKYIQNKIFLKFKKMKYEREAKKYLYSLKKKFSKRIIFVHIRLTDQLVGCYKNASSELPLSWFFKCEKLFKKKFVNCKFIYLSDDLEFLKKNFKNDVFIKKRNKFYNFFIMKNCDGGILSPSTFWNVLKKKKQLPRNMK